MTPETAPTPVRPERRRTPLRSAGLAAALLLAAAPLLLAACGDRDASADGPPPWARGGSGGPAAVRTAEVTHGPFTARAEYVGTLEARSQADLYARSSGPVVELAADLGDRVRQGQVLARIEAAEEEERLGQARANLRIAEASVAQRRAGLDIAAATAERTEALFERELVSRQQNDAVQADLAGARAQLQLAEAQVEQARAALSSARVELEQTRVTAPFDGVVGRRYLDLGDFAAANSPVMSVVDLSTIKTTIPVPERDAPRIAVGQDATVRVGSLGGATFPGRLARMSAVFDPESATTRAEIEVDNPDGRLKPGMFATVSIALDREAEALLVPASAVLEEGGRSWVFAVRERTGGDGGAAQGAPGRPDEGGDASPPPLIARRLEVKRLGSAGEGAQHRVAVEGELAAGDRVITLGHESLADGAAVALAEADPSPTAPGDTPDDTAGEETAR